MRTVYLSISCYADYYDFKCKPWVHSLENLLCLNRYKSYPSPICKIIVLDSEGLFFDNLYCFEEDWDSYIRCR